MAFGYAAVLTVVGAQLAYFYGALPDVVASHFGANGLANGYMPRGVFVAFYGGLVLFLLAVFGGIAVVLRSIPVELINLPNKDYWLSGEREASSREWLSRELQRFGLLVVVFIAVIMQRVFMANVDSSPPCLSPTFVLAGVGSLFLAVVVLTIRMIRRFS